jgi:hypothetical protein
MFSYSGGIKQPYGMSKQSIPFTVDSAKNLKISPSNNTAKTFYLETVTVLGARRFTVGLGIVLQAGRSQVNSQWYHWNFLYT